MVGIEYSINISFISACCDGSLRRRSAWFRFHEKEKKKHTKKTYFSPAIYVLSMIIWSVSSRFCCLLQWTAVNLSLQDIIEKNFRHRLQ